MNIVCETVFLEKRRNLGLFSEPQNFHFGFLEKCPLQRDKNKFGGHAIKEGLKDGESPVRCSYTIGSSYCIEITLWKGRVLEASRV